ncbi:MAG: YqgE/AlgH family protein [Rhodospirillales bacterium]|nr:YqgE/AlgH family protein [Rhodospirillales bacterium]
MSKSSINSAPEFLAGQVLIAMPQMQDPRFERAVVYLCAHSADGAMGLVVNRLIDTFQFTDLLDQLNIPATPACQHIRVHFGGPVETGRGFVLHSSDYELDGTLKVDSQFALTATIDVLKDIAKGAGPRRNLLALGYAGWGPGQLDTEMRDNVWLTAPADEELLFAGDIAHTWEKALARLHIDLSLLSSDAGHA